MRIIPYVLASLLIAACSKQQNKLKEEVWTPESGSPVPSITQSTQFATKETILLRRDEGIERSYQTIGKAKIEGTFLQKVTNDKGDLIYLKTQFHEGDFSSYEKKSEKLFTNRFAFLERLKKTEIDLKNAKEIFSPEVILILKDGVSTLAYQIDYVDQHQTAVYRIKVNPSGRVLSHENTSSGFEQGKGVVFPSGPKQSELTEVVLTNLIGDGSLTKNSLRATAQVNEKAHSPNFIFDYEPHDVRFDQVQSFYYIDSAIQFFQTRLGVTLPFALELQTHVGFPEKTNAMFYYPGQIRLGMGDGVNYANIMKDPSIVFHEASHALVDALAKLPLGQGEGGSLNEAFADFFTAVYFQNPNMAEVAYLKGPFKRTVANTKTMKDKTGGLYNDSLIVSGLFWDIKNSIGENKTLDLATKTLVRLGPSGNYSSLSAAVQYALQQGFSESEKKAVAELLLKRGFVSTSSKSNSSF